MFTWDLFSANQKNQYDCQKTKPFSSFTKSTNQTLRQTRRQNYPTAFFDWSLGETSFVIVSTAFLFVIADTTEIIMAILYVRESVISLKIIISLWGDQSAHNNELYANLTPTMKPNFD